MLQRLLADRFQLTMRREVKELPVYVMTVARNGLKLAKSKVEEGDCFATPAAASKKPSHALLGGQGYGLHGEAIDMSDLAVYLENFADRPVDRQYRGQRSLPGRYQRLGAAPPKGLFARNQGGGWVGSRHDASLSTIFGKLGLKLEPQRAPVEMFIIDHVERPHEN